MFNALHHVPGRLRVRSPKVKRNDRMGNHARTVLEELPGASSIEVNTLTGSITVLYDPDVFCPKSAVAVLETHQFIIVQAIEEPAAKSTPSRLNVGHLGRVAAKAAAGVVVEKLIERSATRLIAALI